MRKKCKRLFEKWEQHVLGQKVQSEVSNQLLSTGYEMVLEKKS